MQAKQKSFCQGRIGGCYATGAKYHSSRTLQSYVVIDPSLLGMAGNLRSSTLDRLEPSQNTGVPSVTLLKKRILVRLLPRVRAVPTRKTAHSFQTRVTPARFTVEP